ncbi:MAG: 50S ribosomal protein L11 methyltransferase [Nitriliruptorales bacterium]
MVQRYTIAAAEGVEGELLAAALWNAGTLGVWEHGDRLVAWFPEATSTVPAGGQWEPEPDRDWLAEWKAGFEPVRIGRLTLTPSWHTTERPGEFTIVLDPGMAFGTGHHATTRLCLIALEGTELSGRRVLDIGTGSGVLALAAKRLGAAEVVAVDVDPDAVAVAASNAARNQLSVDLRVGSLEAVAHDAPFDVVVANLSSDLVLKLAADILAVTIPGGLVIVSGLLMEKMGIVSRGFGAQLLTVDREDEWAALTLSTP